ncbi:MAG: MFS transporter, partial [Acidobacteria bacterium]|nr:MFS transporter [Acidobacteriota bacterium]
RAAFWIVGLPGLLLALAVRLHVREPPRGRFDVAVAAPAGPSSAAAEVTWRFVVGRMLRDRSLLHLVVGCTLVSMAAYGINTYAQAYFVRYFRVSYTLVGAIFGILGGVSTGLGTLVGGWLADRLGPERPSAYALVPAFGVTLALPFYLLVFTRETWQAAAWLLFLPGVFHFFYVGPTFGMVQNSMPGPMRATAAAVLLFVVNIFGLGLGPPLCGWMIDAFSASSFGAREVGEFVSRCPGGIGAAAGGPELDALCRGAVAHGTRRGILSMHVFFAWGALHYFASAFALRRRKPASPTVGVPPRRPRDDE